MSVWIHPQKTGLFIAAGFSVGVTHTKREAGLLMPPLMPYKEGVQTVGDPTSQSENEIFSSAPHPVITCLQKQSLFLIYGDFFPDSQEEQREQEHH